MDEEAAHLGAERRLAGGQRLLRSRARHHSTAAPEPAERAQDEIADNEDDDAADAEPARDQGEQAAERAAPAAAETETAALPGPILEIIAFRFVAQPHRLSPRPPNAPTSAPVAIGCATVIAGLMILEGKVALVTGSTSGIGLAIASALAAEGARLMINGFGPQEEIEEICTELGAVHDGADLSDPAAIGAMMKRCAGELGGPDVLVNNAGIQHVSPIEDFPPEKWDAIIAVNLSAAFHTIRLAVPGMKAKGWGRIVNTASAHSLIASPNKSAYVAAKHGIAGLTKTVAIETATSGITVNCISPGYVWTPLVEQQIPDTMKARNMTREQVMNDVLLAAQPTKRFVTPEEVAALAVYLCRDEARSITGANLSIDGGWTAA